METNLIELDLSGWEKSFSRAVESEGLTEGIHEYIFMTPFGLAAQIHSLSGGIYMIGTCKHSDLTAF